MAAFLPVMHLVLRSALVAAFAGMALAASAMAANTETTDLVFAADRVGEDACVDLRLAYSTGSYQGACSDATFGGYLGDSEDVDYPVADGLPLTLDPARAITMQIKTGGWVSDNPLGPIGDETMTVTITGKLVGSTKTVTIGSQSITTPAAERVKSNEQTREFSIDPADDKAGQYKSLNVAVSTGGALMGGYTDTTGASLASFPIVDGTAPPEPDDTE